MKRRTLDEMISYFNQQVSEMDIKREDKIKLLGMIMAIGFEAQKNKWIPCSERMPEYGIEVLTFNRDGEYKVNHIIDEEDGEWFWEGVTAWCELPEPYKEADNERVVR